MEETLHSEKEWSLLSNSLNRAARYFALHNGAQVHRYLGQMEKHASALETALKGDLGKAAAAFLCADENEVS